MGIREDRMYLNDRKAERNALKENAEKQLINDFNNSIIEREDARIAHEAKVNRFYKYKDDVKKTLIREALMNIYKGSIYNISTRESIMCEHLMDQYLNEVGTSKLLKNMKFSENGFLRTIYEKTEEYFKKITDGANVNDPSSQVIKSEDIKAFWKDVDGCEDIEDITNLIRLRVSNAEEEFINKNQEDKEDVKTILNQTAKRIQMAKSSNDNDYSEMVEESESRLAKNKIYQIQHESRHNVFDRMVRNLSEVAMLNEDAKAEFTCENGRLNVEKIVESARCMYTLLEMVGTIQLEEVNQEYIEDTLKSIK